MAISNIAKEGQIARKTYQRRLPENPNKDYYFIMRETGQTEPILVEYGFIDTARDAKKLTTNLDNYVEGVVKAIADYANVPYTPPTTEENIYIVKKGDTLYSIAEQFNTTVNDIKRLNNLTTNTIVLGQKLLIEENNESPSNTTTYKVKKGDSLYKIAEEYNTTVNELKRLNNLTSNTLYIGQELKVPTSSTNGDNGTSDIISDEFEYYTVKKGDSLWLIARNYNITTDELIKMNNLNTINLKVGDQLLVPKTTKTKTYTVKNGDSLWTIARNNNTTVDKLKQANNLTSNLLTIGQVLTIPS